ncbi:Hypothetical protein R9X50_00707800 [Acrodontium crateriforme]|uniref:Uncharacterized protein n=1 Tax=Acrodontium crateriforme TaxID=150365 RepID=A0AAQ3MAS9_9PEZI|nr:Hypothetical protein R9X50_00707800 [Acrodontium crateriforme]
MSSNDKINKEVEQAKDSFLKKLEDDGVVHPRGLAAIGFGPFFLAAIPVTTFIAKEGGIFEKAVNGLCNSIVWLSSAGSQSRIAQTGKIAALSGLYIAATYAFTGAASVAGQAAGCKDGRDNKEPRKSTASLKGLPLRLYSAHYNLMEMFPGFALAAALVQAMAPADQALTNLLGLHVITKLFVYYPSYILNVGPTRSLAHILATSSVIGVCLQLAKRPLL